MNKLETVSWGQEAEDGDNGVETGLQHGQSLNASPRIVLLTTNHLKNI